MGVGCVEGKFEMYFELRVGSLERQRERERDGWNSNCVVIGLCRVVGFECKLS